jgi:hypothetical protein
MKYLAFAIIVLACATSASAQSSSGGGSYFGGRSQIDAAKSYPSGGPYRAINISPTTRRTYSVEADYLPKHNVRKRKVSTKR